MDKKCPSCGNIDGFTPTLVSEEYVCEACGSEFSEVSMEAYTAPNYRKFCEGVVKNIRANLNDAIISSAIGELSEGYINDGPEYSKDFIEKLGSIASELHLDYQAGRRDKYDFQSIMEGVEKLIEFYQLQNPGDEEFELKDEPEEDEDSDDVEIETPREMLGDVGSDNVSTLNPLDMIDAEAPPAERTEHLALATLKTNVEALKNTLGVLDAAEEQEAEEGSDEGPEHEEKEAQIYASLKDAVVQVQAALNDYLENEANAHYNAPTLRNKVDDVVSQIGDEAIDESMAALRAQMNEICSEACQMLEDCGCSMHEDAELVTQDYLDAQLQQAIDTNTQDMAGNVVEAVVGGQNVDPSLLTPESPEPFTPSSEDQAELATLSPENELVAPEEDEIENIPVDDLPFEENQTVIFENEFWSVKGVDGDKVLLESDSGESVLACKDDIILSNREGYDTMNEHFERGTSDLRKAWEAMEKDIENSPILMTPVRRFDLREAKFKGLTGGSNLQVAAKDASKFKKDPNFNPEKTMGKKLDFDSGADSFDPNKTVGPKLDLDSKKGIKDTISSITTVQKKSPIGKTFDVIRLTGSRVDKKSIYDIANMGGKFYLRRSLRDADNKDVSPPLDIVKGGSKEEVLDGLFNLTKIESDKLKEVEGKIDSLSVVQEETLLPNSNIQI